MEKERFAGHTNSINKDYRTRARVCVCVRARARVVDIYIT